MAHVDAPERVRIDPLEVVKDYAAVPRLEYRWVGRENDERDSLRRPNIGGKHGGVVGVGVHEGRSFRSIDIPCSSVVVAFLTRRFDDFALPEPLPV